MKIHPLTSQILKSIAKGIMLVEAKTVTGQAFHGIYIQQLIAKSISKKRSHMESTYIHKNSADGFYVYRQSDRNIIHLMLNHGSISAAIKHSSTQQI